MQVRPHWLLKTSKEIITCINKRHMHCWVSNVAMATYRTLSTSNTPAGNALCLHCHTDKKRCFSKMMAVCQHTPEQCCQLCRSHWLLARALRHDTHTVTRDHVITSPSSTAGK